MSDLVLSSPPLHSNLDIELEHWCIPAWCVILLLLVVTVLVTVLVAVIYWLYCKNKTLKECLYTAKELVRETMTNEDSLKAQVHSALQLLKRTLENQDRLTEELGSSQQLVEQLVQRT